MSTRDEYDEALVGADDRLLDVFGAVTWDDEPVPAEPPTLPVPRTSDADPVLALLQALREDVDDDAPIPVPVLAPVIALRGRRRVHRAAVASAVAAAVLSVSGVAAAGFSGVSSPLYPLHKAIWGPTASQQALHRAERFATLAATHLEAGRLTAAGEALDAAEAALSRVDLEERGNLDARVSGLRDALTAAYAAEAARLQAADDARAAAQAAAHPPAHPASGSKPGDGTDAAHGDGGGSHDHGDTGSDGSTGEHAGGSGGDPGGSGGDSGDGHSGGAGDTEGAARHGGDGPQPPKNDD